MLFIFALLIWLVLGAAPIESVYGPSRSISESGSLARGQINANQNNSRTMKTSVNSSMSSPSPSMSSEEGAAQDNKTNAAFPFGKKLSLKRRSGKGGKGKRGEGGEKKSKDSKDEGGDEEDMWENKSLATDAKVRVWG